MADDILSLKYCKRCSTFKARNEFHVSAKEKDGLQYTCIACKKVNGLAYRKANSEKISLKNSRWLEKNRDTARINSQRWAEENPERIKALKAAWTKKNPEQRRLNEENRRSRKKQSFGKLSDGLSNKLFHLKKGKCACCAKHLGDKYHLDHIMPLALGGSNTDDNIQLLRSICNQQKHAKHPIDFMQQRGFLL